jgi:hypothetical protein
MIAQGSCVQLFLSRADTQRGVGVAYGHPQRVVSSYASPVCLARAHDHFGVATIELLDSDMKSCLGYITCHTLETRRPISNWPR